jgi:hypothetical protein
MATPAITAITARTAQDRLRAEPALELVLTRRSLRILTASRLTFSEF